MELPSVLHPTIYKIGGYHIRVMAYFKLTEPQARAIAMHAYRSRKWSRKDLKKVHTQMWIGDREALALLG